MNLPAELKAEVRQEMQASVVKQEPQEVLRPWQHGAIFLLSCALIVSRRPDAIFQAQFWNEDGHVFFADAYNFGWWPALFRTYEGYYHALPRLGAALALLAPLTLAPLVLNTIAICVQALAVNVLLCLRSSAWGSLRARFLLAGIYLALPNSFEMNATITNSQWILALIAFLLLVMPRPRNNMERVADVCVLLLCGLSGPFCIFLFPIALYAAWRHRERWRWVRAGLIFMTCLVQARSLLNGGFAGRPHVELGANLVLLARVLAGQLYLGSLFGVSPVAAFPGRWLATVLIAIAVGGTLYLSICFMRSREEMRLLLIFAGMILAAAMIAPTPGQMGGTTFWWVALAHGSGARYWYFPDLALAWTIVGFAQSRTRSLQVISVALLCVMSLGIALRWEHPAFRDAHWAEYAKSFETAPAGTAVTIPESTPGWNLMLIKRASR